MNLFRIVVLVLSGLALFYASSTRLINPAEALFLQSYFENPGNSLTANIDLANEIRGVGAVMMLGGISALLGAFRPEFRLTALVVVSVILGGVVIGRSVSFLIDGIPHPNLIRAAAIEFILAALNLFCLIHLLIWEQAGRTG